MDHLCQRVPASNHKTYFDNFTTFDLLEVLPDKKILAAGTARGNRFADPPPLETDKERGNSDQVTSRDGKTDLAKWYDYHPDTLDSSFVGVGQRWDKKRTHPYQAPRGCEEILPGHGWSRQAGPNHKSLQDGNKIKKVSATHDHPHIRSGSCE